VRERQRDKERGIQLSESLGPTLTMIPFGSDPLVSNGLEFSQP
jgi:hypothetical protein